MITNDIISRGTHIYSSIEKDENLRMIALQKRSCEVSYYSTQPLTSVDEVILGILMAEPENSMSFESLGTTLGFDVVNSPLEGKFYDDAENNIFVNLVKDLQAWGLIEVAEDMVRITGIGRLAYSTKLKYRFFKKGTDYFDFLYLRNNRKEEVEDFPFSKELDCRIDLSHGRQLPYSDELVDAVISRQSSRLINRISLQTRDDYIVYNVEDIGFITPAKVSLQTDLYSVDGKMCVVFSCNGEYCDRLFELYESKENKSEKEKKIEWALLYQILNDPTAILDFSNIGRFDDILEIEKLIPDKRLKWSDPNLLKLIIRKCNGNDWHNLSHYCDCDVLKTLLDTYKDVLDWSELTIRMDEAFISSTSKQYPWERVALFSREPMSEALIRQFLTEYDFPDGQDDGIWEWEEVLPIVGLDYIKDHISAIPFNLFSLTPNLNEVDWHLVPEYPEARWNWSYISSHFHWDFLCNNIDCLANHLNIEVFLGRVFTDRETASVVANDSHVFEVLSSLLEDESTRFSVNNRAFVWNDDVISFLEGLHLLTWPSGAYSPGFECNPHIVWNREFFAKHWSKVATEKGFAFVSATISETAIVDDFPSFNWDFTALSANKSVFTDIAFISSHKDRLNAGVLLSHALREDEIPSDMLLGLFDTSTLLETDEGLRMLITDKASEDFIRKNIKYNWDWSVLTRRLYDKLKIDVIGNETWANKWDWDYLSKNRRIDDILSYAVQYNRHWNWDLIISRMTGDDLLEDNILQTLSKAFEGLEKQTDFCLSVTNKYTKEKLIELTSHDGRRDDFEWDFAYLYSMPGFDAKDFLENHLGDISWSDFSSSASVNKMFSTSGKGKKATLWIQHYTKLLSNENYHWDFRALSTLENVLRQPRLLSINKEWDWEYISENADWISFEPKRDYYLGQYLKKLSFRILSKREDIGLSEDAVVKYEKKADWDWEALANNPSIRFSFDYIKKHPDKLWNWVLLSKRDDLSSDVVSDNVDKPWDWPTIVAKKWFEPTIEIMEVASRFIDNDSWDLLSVNANITPAVVEKYPTFINWRLFVSRNESFEKIASVSFLKKHDAFIPWGAFNERIKSRIRTEFVEAFSERLDWHYVSRSQDLKFSIDFIRKYENLWHWSELCDNMKVRELIPDFDQVFHEHTRSARFVNSLKKKVRTPYIYHFTHLFNAIDVIKSRKILSRDRALEFGLLKFDSAGSVISRSSKAHKFARFYFRPCTPTQYYNEALGADSRLGYFNKRGEWKSKYPSAVNLGLPKCPVPVFFRFDLEEVLTAMQEKCFYSDRNMQSDCPIIYSVLKEPDHLMTNYLYSTMQDAFNAAIRYGDYDRSLLISEMERVKKYSQQEFLVDTEFDFSTLKNFEIICYNQEYAELLKSLLGEDPICEKITHCCDEALFERENRSIDFVEKDGSTSISSNFEDEHYYLIKSQSLDRIHFKVEPSRVIFETRDSIKLREPIQWETTLLPLQVYFVDPNARTKEWLIYENTVNQDTNSAISPLIASRLSAFSSEMSRLPIKLAKDLFYPHMISSYHGIGHTARVVFYTYLLSVGIDRLNERERQACCLAAVIHDLGKQSDREGAIHGHNSMLLYKDRLAGYVEDQKLGCRIFDAVQYHSVDDRDCPCSAMDDLITKVLKDADALDRSRFGGRGCDRSYLRLGLYDTPYGEAILKIAEILPALTERCNWDNPYEDIIETIRMFI